MTKEDFKANILPHYKTMYRVAASVMGSADEAADAVQDVMLKLWNIRDRLCYVEDVGAYCLRMVKNLCINNMNRRKISEEITVMHNVASEEDIHSSVEWRDSADVVKRAMDSLTPDQKYVMGLSAYGGFSNAEIAELLGMTPGNVRVILSRARTRLRELLSDIK